MEKVSCDICNRKFKTNEALKQHKNVIHKEVIITTVERKRTLAKVPIIGVVSALLVIGVIGYFAFTSITGRFVEPGLYDEFAQCLTEKGAVFYGAYWCPHCAEQKKMFGPSIKFVKYVECDPKGKNAQPELCVENNIRGYPTWIIDGKSYSGVQSLEKLSKLTNCPLEKK
ncbi:MAG: hypothetical protein QW818_02265 [Candidatus Aenigmatarchaeota archaeon]|nr:thioredoxin [Candidatus Aenigmarchaeota archaeon]